MWGDVGLSSTASAADAIFLDIMLLTHAERAWSLGASSVDVFVDELRTRDGKSKTNCPGACDPDEWPSDANTFNLS